MDVPLELNNRWRLLEQTVDLRTAGVLIHVLDGDGLTPGVSGGFVSGPPNLEEPLKRDGRYLWDDNPNQASGDRMSGSLINVRHPEVFQCRGICGNDWWDLPAIVLKPQASARCDPACGPFFE